MILGFFSSVALLLKSIIFFMLLPQEVILAVFAPSPPFSSHVFLVIKVSAHFSTEVLIVMVPGWCHSRGCHGYLLFTCCSFLFYQAPSPHPSIFDRFETQNKQPVTPLIVFLTLIFLLNSSRTSQAGLFFSLFLFKGSNCRIVKWQKLML